MHQLWAPKFLSATILWLLAFILNNLYWYNLVFAKMMYISFRLIQFRSMNLLAWVS